MRRRYSILLIALLLLQACQETRVVHDNSASAKFLAMVGGNPSGSSTNGVWQVGSNDPAAQQKPKNAADPNVRVIREADWGQYHFQTNFQIDDAAHRAAAQNAATQPATQPMPVFSPFGAVPVQDH